MSVFTDLVLPQNSVLACYPAPLAPAWNPTEQARLACLCITETRAGTTEYTEAEGVGREEEEAWLYVKGGR